MLVGVAVLTVGRKDELLEEHADDAGKRRPGSPLHAGGGVFHELDGRGALHSLRPIRGGGGIEVGECGPGVAVFGGNIHLLARGKELRHFAVRVVGVAENAAMRGTHAHAGRELTGGRVFTAVVAFIRRAGDIVLEACAVGAGLDAGTAFEILSIDIADIDIGKNIGAVLQMDQAEADKNIAQARAEERRAMAVALEQEMKAKAQEARARVIEAEAEVPLAMAEAFRTGNLGIMDYYKMKNIQADTEMRENIAKQ